jgi:AAHS family benzoate transporter-like MFS transporter
LLIILFDGYDLAINGVVLPLLMEDWGLSAVQAGMLASTALAGMMFGAMIFGSLADKIGRKKVIMILLCFLAGLPVQVVLHQTQQNLRFYVSLQDLELVG